MALSLIAVDLTFMDLEKIVTKKMFDDQYFRKKACQANGFAITYRPEEKDLSIIFAALQQNPAVYTHPSEEIRISVHRLLLGHGLRIGALRSARQASSR